MKRGFVVHYLTLKLKGEKIQQLYDQYDEGPINVTRITVPDSDKISMPYQGTEEEQLVRRKIFFAHACAHIKKTYSPDRVYIHLHGFFIVPLMAGALTEYNILSTYHLLITGRANQRGQDIGRLYTQLRIMEALSVLCNRKIQAISPGMREELLTLVDEYSQSCKKHKLREIAHEMGITLPYESIGTSARSMLENSIRVIPNAIDGSFFTLQPFASPLPNHVVAWGRISGEKGFEYLIRAAEYLPSVSFDIMGILGDDEAGRREYHELLEHEAKKFDNVTLDFRPDGVRGEELIQRIDRADIVVVPSLYEPFGLVHVEALARDKPIIATATTGGKYVMDGETPGVYAYGYLVRPYPETLPGEITRCLEDFFNMETHEKTAMRKAAVKVSQKYNWKNVTEKVLDFFQISRR
jgi:glycosyltransferase involved in cell wall biosynthesis